MTAAAKVSRWIATWFGCGHSPIAPGTVGTLGALPVHAALQAGPLALRWSVVASLTVSGIWAAHQVAKQEGTHDPQIVVIDEVAGVLIALSLVTGHGFWSGALAFLAFRVLDIWKPGPIAVAERARPTGLGIMLDDILAGLIAGLLIRLVR